MKGGGGVTRAVFSVPRHVIALSPEPTGERRVTRAVSSVPKHVIALSSELTGFLPEL